MSTNRDRVSDVALARAFLQGEHRAVREVTSIITRVVAFDGGYFIPQSEREDVVQETIISLLKALPPVLQAGFSTSLVAFVRAIAHRRCVEWLRRLRLNCREALVDTPLPGDDAEHEILSRERDRVAWRVLKALGERCRRLIELFVIERLSYEQIAIRLGRSPAGLRVQMCHCLKAARSIRQKIETSNLGTRL